MIAFEGTYYKVEKGRGRQWLVIDKFSGAVLDSGIRSCMVMYASAINRMKENREMGRS
jgi:hypothetical protein